MPAVLNPSVATWSLQNKGKGGMFNKKNAYKNR